MAISDATSLTYQVPQGGLGGPGFIQPPTPPQAFAPASGQAMLPPQNEDLAIVEGLTNRYYDTYGKLKSFVESHNSMGVDVTKPSYGDPSKQELYNTYKMMEANVMTTAAQLKQQQKTLATLRPLEAQGKYRFAEGVEPDQELITGMSPNEIGFSTDLEQGVEKSMEILSENPMTESDRRNQEKYFNEVSSELDKRILNATSPGEKQRLKYEKDQLTKAYKATKLFAPPNPYSSAFLGQQTKFDAAESFYRQVTNKGAGVFENPEYEIDKDFNVVAKDSSLMDMQLGKGDYTIKGKRTSYPKVVDHLYRKDGKTFIRFQQPSRLLSSGRIAQDTAIDLTKPDIIKDEELTSNGVDFVRTILENNPNKLGFSHADVLTALQNKGLLDKQTRYSKDDKVIQKESVVNAPDNTVVKQKATELQETLKKKGTPLTLQLPNGQVATIDSGWNGYYIEIDGEEVIKKLGSDPKKVSEYLRANTSYFDQFLNTQSAAPAVTPEPTAKPKSKFLPSN